MPRTEGRRHGPVIAVLLLPAPGVLLRLSPSARDGAVSGAGAPSSVADRGQPPRIRLPRARGVPQVALVVRPLIAAAGFVGTRPAPRAKARPSGGVAAGGDTDAPLGARHLLPVRRGQAASARQAPVRAVAARARARVPQVEAANDPRVATRPMVFLA